MREKKRWLQQRSWGGQRKGRIDTKKRKIFVFLKKIFVFLKKDIFFFFWKRYFSEDGRKERGEAFYFLRVSYEGWPKGRGRLFWAERVSYGWERGVCREGEAFLSRESKLRRRGLLFARRGSGREGEAFLSWESKLRRRERVFGEGNSLRELRLDFFWLEEPGICAVFSLSLIIHWFSTT